MRLRSGCLAVVLLLAPVHVRAAEPALTAAELTEMFRAYGDSGEGWTGGDGAYSVPLPDGRIAWLFSDTFLGPVNEDGSRPSGTPFIHNSIVVQDGTSLTTIVDDTETRPVDAISPQPPGGYYWMGDGTVEGDVLRVFVYRFVAAPIPFGFQQVATDLATLSLPDLELVSIEHLPFGFIPAAGAGPVTYGNAIMEHGAYTYVYGVEDLHVEKYLHLARAAAGSVAGPWEFWTGSAWSTNPLSSARLLEGLSNEPSVMQVGDRYVLVAQVGARVMTSVAEAPEGPWPAAHEIAVTPEATGTTFTYNAKAHPQFSTDDSMLVSYNVNTTNFAALYQDVTIYRPRFVSLPMPGRMVGGGVTRAEGASQSEAELRVVVAPFDRAEYAHSADATAPFRASSAAFADTSGLIELFANAYSSHAPAVRETAAASAVAVIGTGDLADIPPSGRVTATFDANVVMEEEVAARAAPPAGPLDLDSEFVPFSARVTMSSGDLDIVVESQPIAVSWSHADTVLVNGHRRQRLRGTFSATAWFDGPRDGPTPQVLFIVEVASSLHPGWEVEAASRTVHVQSLTLREILIQAE